MLPNDGLLLKTAEKRRDKKMDLDNKENYINSALSAFSAVNMFETFILSSPMSGGQNEE